MDRRTWSSLLLGSFFASSDPHSGLAENLTVLFPPDSVGGGRLPFELISLSLRFVILIVSLTCMYFPTSGRMDTTQPVP
jgi:hypothetical protein